MANRVPSFRPDWLPPPSNPERHRNYNQFRRDPFLLELYGSTRWKKFRARIRRERILCQRCSTKERPVAGAEVHHKVSPREDLTLAFVDTNVELLCKSCHSRETASTTQNRGQ